MRRLAPAAPTLDDDAAGIDAWMYERVDPRRLSLTLRRERAMTTFSVWKFDDPAGAERAVGLIKNAEADRLVKVDDHAVVTWPVGAAQPDTKHGHEETWRGAGWGGLLGLLVGTLFFIPVVGGLAGAAIGALAKATEDAGITKEQLETIRGQVTEGTSALFLVTEQADVDRLAERMRGMHTTLLATNLTDAERNELLSTFGGA